MNIAENKKRTNISEYIIHMYQTEDLIRAFDFDMDNIRQYVIKHIPVDEAEKEELAGWYQGIMKKMEQEGVNEKGHLQETQKHVDELTDLAEKLKVEDDRFKAIYDSAKPHIDEGLEFAKGEINGEIQICLNGIYGLLLARMNGREVPEELMTGINSFGEVLSYLSYKYKERNEVRDN